MLVSFVCLNFIEIESYFTYPLFPCSAFLRIRPCCCLEFCFVPISLPSGILLYRMEFLIQSSVYVHTTINGLWVVLCIYEQKCSEHPCTRPLTYTCQQFSRCVPAVGLLNHRICMCSTSLRNIHLVSVLVI